MTPLLSVFISIHLSGIFAQSTIVPAPAQTTPIIIEHAIIHTAVQGASVIQDGFVIMDNGVIVSVGSGTPVGSKGEAPPPTRSGSMQLECISRLVSSLAQQRLD